MTKKKQGMEGEIRSDHKHSSHSHPQPSGVRRPLLERCSAAAEWVGSLCTPRGMAELRGKRKTDH